MEAEEVKQELLDTPTERYYYLPIYRYGDIWHIALFSYIPETIEDAAECLAKIDNPVDRADETKILKIKLPYTTDNEQVNNF